MPRIALKTLREEIINALSADRRVTDIVDASNIRGYDGDWRVAEDSLAGLQFPCILVSFDAQDYNEINLGSTQAQGIPSIAIRVLIKNQLGDNARSDGDGVDAGAWEIADEIHNVLDFTSLTAGNVFQASDLEKFEMTGDSFLGSNEDLSTSALQIGYKTNYFFGGDV